MIINGIKIYQGDKNLEMSERVAIVGNSGNILGKSLGEKIDSFDRVVRFNAAKIEGFEKDVGTKTTDLVINCHVYNGLDLKECGFESYENNFLEKYSNINVIYVNTNTPGRGRGTVPENLDFYIMEKGYFDMTAHGPYKVGSIPTVGYAFIAHMVMNGIKPHIFGFSTPEDEWDHYYEKRPEPSVSHNQDREKNLLKEMIKNNLIVNGAK